MDILTVLFLAICESEYLFTKVFFSFFHQCLIVFSVSFTSCFCLNLFLSKYIGFDAIVVGMVFFITFQIIHCCFIETILIFLLPVLLRCNIHIVQFKFKVNSDNLIYIYHKVITTINLVIIHHLI